MNTLSPPSQVKVIVKYRFRRLFNLLSTGFKKKPKSGEPRVATARKGTRGWITALLLSGFIMFSSGHQAYQMILKTSEILGQTQAIENQESFPAWDCAKSSYQREKQSIECKPIEDQTNELLIPAQLAKGIALELLFLFISVFLLNIASKELTQPEWDLEWLATMPLPLSKLIGVRIFERTLVNPSGLLIIWPFLTLLLFLKTKLGYFSVPVGFLGSLFMLYFEAVFRTIVDTGLRMVISPSRLRNMQAVTSLFASGSLLLAMSVMLNEKPAILQWSLSPYFDFLSWTPMGLVTNLFTSQSFASASKNLLILSLEIGFTYLISSKLILHWLRFGIVAGGSREGVKRSIASIPAVIQPTSERKSILSPIQRRELKLLMRDRNFMVQTLILPIFIAGMQFFTSGANRWTELFKGGFKQVAATAFGAAAYALLFSAFHVLNAEGKSLWMLYTFPTRLEGIIRQKIYLWLAVALLYPLVLFGAGIYLSGIPSFRSSFLIFVVLVGIVIYGTVAACFGVFASDPLAEDPRHRTRLDYTYLYMILAGFYTYAIFAKSYWDKTALVVLSSLMALALFQKARDHLPYLLDPTESPKSSVSLSDGLIAALIFFVIQGITTVFLVSKDHSLSGQDLLIAFSIAGAITFGSLRTIYWRKKTTGVPKIFEKNQLSTPVLYGLAGGIIAGLIGILYLNFITSHNLFSDVTSQAAAADPKTQWWFFGLAVCAAPLFEEFIFRGIIFKGLARTWSLPIAMISSAAIFAIVHPPISVAPVFCLALVTSFTYSRTKLLLAPMIAHAVYNFMVLSYQMDFLGWMK